MNITKEYIDLCKNDKVQGLRPFALDYGEWYCAEYTKGIIEICCVDNRYGRQMPERTCEYWLPQEHNLDREIEKILSKMSKNGEDLSYNLGVSFSDGQISAWQITVENRDCAHEEMDINPLIAKLKLLLSLLESEE